MDSNRPTSERDVVAQFRDNLRLRGRITIDTFLADGSHRQKVVENTVTGAGRNNLAARAIVSSYAPFAYMAVGSGSDAPAIADTALTYEVARKAATMASSNEVIIGVCCFGGSADSVTSAFLDEAGLFTTANSGTGTMLNRLLGVSHTFADSDVVKVTMEVSVGSYA